MIHECLDVLCHFNEATVELAEEKRVSGSKVIPLFRMLRHAVNIKLSQAQNIKAQQLCKNLLRLLMERLSNYETMSIMTLATLLDPRYKTAGFCNQSNAQTAVKRLTAECASIIRSQEAQQNPSTSTYTQPPEPEPAGTSSGTAMATGLWDLLDSDVGESRRIKSSTADATVEVRQYLSDPNIPRTEGPLRFWNMQQAVPVEEGARILERAFRPPAPRVFKDRVNLLAFSDDYLWERYQFSRPSIVYLCELLEPHLSKPTRRSQSLTTVQSVCIALRFFASGTFLYSVGDAEHLAKATVCREIKRVYLALRQYLNIHITFPGHLPTQRIKENFYAIADFPNVLGAVDGIHIRIQAPAEPTEADYVNRKSFHSLNVQIPVPEGP
nr:uncharacterized protein LOC111835835 [Paramormyrops kingsleyae]